MAILRWLAVIPGAISGWFLALALGFVIVSVIDSYCPPDQVESGMCIAPWYSTAFDAAVCFSAALAAFLVVLFASVMAPAHQRAVSWVAYVSGAVATVAMTGTSPNVRTLNAAICALLAGLLSVWLVWFLTRKPRVVA
jgi:hypothetical protein